MDNVGTPTHITLHQLQHPHGQEISRYLETFTENCPIFSEHTELSKARDLRSIYSKIGNSNDISSICLEMNLFKAVNAGKGYKLQSKYVEHFCWKCKVE